MSVFIVVYFLLGCIKKAQRDVFSISISIGLARYGIAIRLRSTVSIDLNV